MDLLVPISLNCLFEESNDEQRPLNGEHDQKEGEADSAVAVLLQEGHQVAEANEHHHGDVGVERVIARHHVVTVGLEQRVLRRVVVDNEGVDEDHRDLEDDGEDRKGVGGRVGRGVVVLARAVTGVAVRLVRAAVTVRLAVSVHVIAVVVRGNAVVVRGGLGLLLAGGGRRRVLRTEREAVVGVVVRGVVHGLHFDRVLGLRIRSGL